MTGDDVERDAAAEAGPAPTKADLLDYIADMAGELAQTALDHRETFLNYLLRIVSEEALDRAKAEHGGVRDGAVMHH